MRILIVEDDYLQADLLRQILVDRYGSVETDRVKSESAFRNRMSEIRKQPPDLILLDVMLQWTDRDTYLPAPDDVIKGEFYRAGLRCERLLRDDSITRKIPVILYTMLESRDLGEDLCYLSNKTRFVGKYSDSSLLFDTIQELRKR